METWIKKDGNIFPFYLQTKENAAPACLSLTPDSSRGSNSEKNPPACVQHGGETTH